MLKNRTFLGLIVSVFFMMVGVGMIVARLPQKIIHLTGSGDTVGFLASAFAISYILFQLPIGNLADRIGVKTILTSGYILCSCAGILYYFSKTAQMIFVGRFLQGLGEVPVWALVPAFLSNQYPRMKGRAIGIYNTAFHLGLTAGPVLGIYIQRIFFGNQPFLIYSILCFSGAVIIQICTANIDPGQEIEKISLKPRDLAAVLSKRMALVILSGITLYGAGYGVFITVLPVFLTGSKGFNPALNGVFFSTFYIGISISLLVTGPLSDAFGRTKFMITGLLTAAVSLFVFQVFDFFGAIFFLGLASLGLGTFFLSSLAYLNEMVESGSRGTMSGAYFLFWGIGYFSGPLIINLCEQSIGPGKGFYIFGFLLFCQACLLMISHGLNSSGETAGNKKRDAIL